MHSNPSKIASIRVIIDVDFALVKEHVDHRLVAILGGSRQRRPAIVVFRVDSDLARVKEHLDQPS